MCHDRIAEGQDNHLQRHCAHTQIYESPYSSISFYGNRIRGQAFTGGYLATIPTEFERKTPTSLVSHLITWSYQPEHRMHACFSKFFNSGGRTASNHHATWFSHINFPLNPLKPHVPLALTLSNSAFRPQRLFIGLNIILIDLHCDYFSQRH